MHINAEPVLDGALTDRQVMQWRTEGFAFVRGLLPDDLVHELRSAALATFPAPNSRAAANMTDFGSGERFVFPSPHTVFNEITLHPYLLRAMGRLLDVPVHDIRLTQSDLWPKYHRTDKVGDRDNSDQRVHVDYPNHTLVHPTPWDRPEAVELILYLDDVEQTGGGTAVIARQGDDDPAYRWPIIASPGIGELRYVNDRDAAENYLTEVRPEFAEFRQQLYRREALTKFRVGDVLLYRHDTWHRGTPMKSGALRLAANMTFRKAASEWISTLHTGWAWSAYRDDKLLERMIARASLEQRAVLGFPQPGSDYWCEETIAAVSARYGMYGFDPEPYRTAMRAIGE